jgi:uncharacterized protein YndB with AHSA1/START domain
MQNADNYSVTAPNDLEILVTRTFNAPRELVFQAFTDPQYIPRWMLGPDGWSMPVCEIDLRVGGAWHMVWRRDDGTEMEMRGVYREIDPPARLVTTESWGGDWPETVNSFVLAEHAGRTTLTQTMRYPSKQARDRALQTGIKEGMAMSFARLDRALTAGA